MGSERDEGEAIAPFFGGVDVSFSGVVGGGLDYLAVGDGGLDLDEGLEDGWVGGTGDENVDIAGGLDVAPGDAAVN